MTVADLRFILARLPAEHDHDDVMVLMDGVHAPVSSWDIQPGEIAFCSALVFAFNVMTHRKGLAIVEAIDAQLKAERERASE